MLSGVMHALPVAGLFYMLLIFCGLAFLMVGLENAVIWIGRRQVDAHPSCPLPCADVCELAATHRLSRMSVVHTQDRFMCLCRSYLNGTQAKPAQPMLCQGWELGQGVACYRSLFRF